MAVGPISGSGAWHATAEVGADMSAARGKGLEFATEGKVTVANATSDIVLGVATENASGTATSGLYIQVCVAGFTRFRAGEAITVADRLWVAADGEWTGQTGTLIKPAGGGAETMHLTRGVALEAAAAAGEFFGGLLFANVGYGLV